MKSRPSLRSLAILAAIASITSAEWAQNIPLHTAPIACDVTTPNQSEPPVKNFGGIQTHSPDYKGQRDGPTVNSYGNGKLWTVLWPEGTIVFQAGGSGFILSDGSLSMKQMWYRAVRGKLTVHGRRLDMLAPPLRASIPDGYGDSGFQASALIFPTEGCWEVTGQVGEASLTFVTRVVKVKQAASP